MAKAAAAGVLAPAAISPADLKAMARGRLRDARVLLQANRLDGAVYLCGYAVEMALKARICRTLRWPEFPQKSDHTKVLRTHSLAVLLEYSGIDSRIKTNYMAAWSAVQNWNPESRYDPTRVVSQQEANDMISAAATLLRTI